MPRSCAEWSVFPSKIAIATYEFTAQSQHLGHERQMTVSVSNRGSGSRMRADQSVEKLAPGTKQEAGKIILLDGALAVGRQHTQGDERKDLPLAGCPGEVLSAGKG